MKWFFLMSFVAALIICAIVTLIIVVGLVTHRVGAMRMLAIFLPQLGFFIWAAREMFRSFKGDRLNN